MKKSIVILVVAAVFLSSLSAVGVARAQDQDETDALWSVVNKLDIAASALRRADSQSARASLSTAARVYETELGPRISQIDDSLNERIEQDFIIVTQGPSEADIFSLRSDVIEAAGLIGVQLPVLYSYSLFIVLGIGFSAAFFVTYLSKRIVNWDLIKQSRKKTSEYYKELRDAQRRRDVKSMHKIEERKNEIMALQKANARETFKQTIVYLPLLLLWWSFGAIFQGWVVAWMPFVRVDLPFFGPLVTFGVGWWYFVTYLGSSQILRKVMIGD